MFDVYGPTGVEDRNHRLMFWDITRAHPHCVMTRNVYVQLPQEDPRSGESDVCGLLKRSLYGLRDAGRNFELFMRTTMESLGFVARLWPPCIFVHDKDDMQAYVDGDTS